MNSTTWLRTEVICAVCHERGWAAWMATVWSLDARGVLVHLHCVKPALDGGEDE